MAFPTPGTGSDFTNPSSTEELFLLDKHGLNWVVQRGINGTSPANWAGGTTWLYGDSAGAGQFGNPNVDYSWNYAIDTTGVNVASLFVDTNSPVAHGYINTSATVDSQLNFRFPRCRTNTAYDGTGGTGCMFSRYGLNNTYVNDYGETIGVSVQFHSQTGLNTYNQVDDHPFYPYFTKSKMVHDRPSH